MKEKFDEKVMLIDGMSDIVSSVRDVIESENGGEKDAFICALLNKWYDAILVHSDERIVPFKASFPMADQIKVPL